MRIGKGIVDRIKLSEPFVTVIGGAVLAGLALAVSPQCLGLGLTTTENVLRGGDTIWYVFLPKMIFTSVTFNSGDLTFRLQARLKDLRKVFFPDKEK